MASRLRVTYPSQSPLTADLRSSLMSALLTTSAIPDLHALLLSSSQSTGWLDSVRERAVQLLRNGDCGTYGQVMAVIIAESRGKHGNHYKEEKVQKNEASEKLVRNGQEICDEDQGERDLKSYKKDMHGGEGKQKKIDVKIPESIITEGQALLKLALEQVVKVVREEEKAYLA